MVGSPRLYRPGQVYTVTLSGERMDEGDLEPKKVKFIDFMVVAESNLPSTEVHGLGVFQLMPGDAMSKFSHKCSHAVMATSALSKEEVQVLWTAPEMGSGCIQLKAMVVERNDYWFMDDGGKSCRDILDINLRVTFQRLPTEFVRTTVPWLLRPLWSRAERVTRPSMRSFLKVSGPATPIPRTSPAMSGPLPSPT